MQPNTPPAPPPMDPQRRPVERNPYDFIVDPGQPALKKKFALPKGSSKSQRIFMGLGGGVILITLIVLVSTILGSGDKAKKQQLVSVVSQQKELIRVAEIGVKKAKGVEAKNLAVTTQLTLTSEQTALLSSLKSMGVKTDSKTLGGKNTKTDATLTAAEQANNFDAVFIETIQTDLTTYAKSVQTAYKSNSSKKTKAALEAQFKNAAILANFKEE